eukprot:3729805-Rhodomonas_salina.1
MGWTRIAIIYVNDAWGRGFFQDIGEAASRAGVDVVTTPSFALGDQTTIEQAVEQVAESGARVTICAAFDTDIAAIAAAADSLGLLRSGYAWIVGNSVSVEALMSASPHPASTVEHVAGWFFASIDPLYDGGFEQFQNAFLSEPLQHLNHSGLEGLVSEDVISGGQCDQFCALAYDAVWTAAIALARVGLAGDGSVDKEALLSAIRNVSFDGASGSVRYGSETGERDTSLLPLIIKNIIQEVGADGKGSLSSVTRFRWQSGTLRQEGSEPPVWPGGERGWQLPLEVVECAD